MRAIPPHLGEIYLSWYYHEQNYGIPGNAGKPRQSRSSAPGPYRPGRRMLLQEKRKNFGESMETPEEDCNQNAGKCDQKKADKCLIQGDSNMVKDRTILCLSLIHIYHRAV